MTESADSAKPGAEGSPVRGVADELIALATPAGFFAAGQVYVDFSQTSEAEAVELPGAGPGDPRPPADRVPCHERPRLSR